MNMFRLAVFLTFCGTTALASVVSDCYNHPAELFSPWGADQLSEEYCVPQFFGTAWCVDSAATCTTNAGIVSNRGSYEPGRNASGWCRTPEQPVCCFNSNGLCTAQAINQTKDGLFGTCMKPGFCTRVAAKASDDSDCGGRGGLQGLICCVDDYDRPLEYTPCIQGYDKMVDNALASNVTQFLNITRQRLTNFLPIFGQQYYMMQYYQEGQACKSANYMAVVLQLLSRISYDPDSTLQAILSTLSAKPFNDNLISNIKAFTADGLVTPRGFAKVMQSLWDSLSLGYYGGTCADYQKTTGLINNQYYPCDGLWRSIMASFGCPVTN